MERVEHDVLERVAGLTGQAVYRHQPVHRAGTGEILVVDVDPGRRKGAVARHVALVGVAVDDRIDRLGAIVAGKAGQGAGAGVIDGFVQRGAQRAIEREAGSGRQQPVP